MSKRKLSKNQARDIRVRLQGIIEVLDDVLQNNFIRERMFQQIYDAKDWAEELEWMFR